MRRYTRLSNGFSRKIENHFAAVALNYFAYKLHQDSRYTPMQPAHGRRRHKRAVGSLGPGCAVGRVSAEGRKSGVMPYHKQILECGMLVIAVAGVVGGIWNRIKTSKGIGARFLQYLGLTVLLPLVVILSLEDRISQEMTGAIAIAAVGGLLASIGKDE